MPRGTRIELAGGVHHVTAKTPSGRSLFHDNSDRQRYLHLLAEEVEAREWRVMTYCQLTNHLHVLVKTPRPDLGAGFKRIHEDFARYINRRHGLDGHVFGDRFYSGLVVSERHAVGCFRYIARNPIEAGICSRARDWPWSAHSALAGLAEPPGFLDLDAAYGQLGENPRSARLNYLQAVAKSDTQLLGDLARPDSDDWLLSAIDEFSIPMRDLAAFLNVGLSTVYRRICAARENEGTVPRFSVGNEGTVPRVSAEG
jgi:REP element-mobilizing transposase RayT